VLHAQDTGSNDVNSVVKKLPARISIGLHPSGRSPARNLTFVRPHSTRCHEHNHGPQNSVVLWTMDEKESINFAATVMHLDVVPATGAFPHLALYHNASLFHVLADLNDTSYRVSESRATPEKYLQKQRPTSKGLNGLHGFDAHNLSDVLYVFRTSEAWARS